MSNQAVEIEILGKITRVNCPKGQEAALQAAAADLDERLKEMTRKTQVANTEKLMTIAALNLSYELLEQRTEVRTQEDVTERLEQLSGKLSVALS